MPIKVQGGKEYKLVSERLGVFFADYGARVNTMIAHVGDGGVIMKAEIVKDGEVISTGHASAPFTTDDKQLEKCETVAVGRALAFLSKELMGSEIASADEMHKFHEQQATERLIRHNLAWRTHEASLLAIKESLYNGDLSAAWEAWNEIPENDRISLRVAATKGGVFSIEEGKLLKQASEEDFNPETGVYESIARKSANG